MFLYWLAAERRYVHRQSDIPKGVESERVDVPTDTAGLMAYLNSLVKIEADPNPAPAEMPLAAIPIAVGEIAEVAEVFIDDKPIPRPMDAGAILSRVDSPGVDVEAVVEAIGKSKGYALRRYAGAVAVRFQELENKS